MTDLTEFLLARIGDDETMRRIVEGGDRKCGRYGESGWHYPDRGWRACSDCVAARSADLEWGRVVRLLALLYADHPDYRQEWRP